MNSQPVLKEIDSWIEIKMTESKNEDHRKRLRERFVKGEGSSHSEEAILELLLTYAISQKDVQLIAKRLLAEFGGLVALLEAPMDTLSTSDSIKEKSAVLLKLVDWIRRHHAAKRPIRETVKTVTQASLFEVPTDEKGKKAEPVKKKPARVSPTSPKTQAFEKSVRRKFQVSNGYLLEFDQLARVLHFLLEHRDAKRINRKVLQEDTGLADRQVASLVSMGSAMGLIKPGLQVLTPAGLLIAEHDIFLEKKGSLEWCHYVGAGSYRNLIWFEIFNRILREASPMTQEEWSERIRSDLGGKYSKRTISKGLHEEIRFVVDAYMKRNFGKLEILHQMPDERLYRRRYTSFAPLVLAVMIYDFCATNEAPLFQVAEMTTTPGSPAVVFGLDEAAFRQQVEGLHERGWLRYETTHNLDQIRLKPGFCALEFLTAHFEDREPHPNDELGMMNDE